MYRLEHGGKSTKEGTRSGVDRRERMKRGSGIKDRDERSKGIEILQFYLLLSGKTRAKIILTTDAFCLSLSLDSIFGQNFLSSSRSLSLWKNEFTKIKYVFYYEQRVK